MGGCRCSFFGCENSTATSPGMHFFHYPIRDMNRAKEWALNARRLNFLKLPTEKFRNKVVCEVHFVDRCFMNIKKERLIKTAVPTLFKGSDGLMTDVSQNLEVEVPNIQPEQVPQKEVMSNIKQLPKNVEPILLNKIKRPFLHNSDNFRKEVKQEKESGILVNLAINNVDEDLYTMNQTYKKIKIGPKFIKNPQILSVSSVGQKKILNSCLMPGNKGAEVINTSIVINPANKSEDIITSSIDDGNDDQLKCSSMNSSDMFDVIDLNNLNSTEVLSTVTIESISAALSDVIATHNPVNTDTFNHEMEQQRNDMKNVLDKLVSLEKQQEKFMDNLKSGMIPHQTSSSNVKVKEDSEMTKSKLYQNKIQLFNGLKKYLNPSMVALLRVELFGSNERKWASDEKSMCVELYNLGKPTYEFFRDIWRVRLPAISEVEKWSIEGEEDDNDYM